MEETHSCIKDVLSLHEFSDTVVLAVGDNRRES